jgi:hypothetical protein
MDRDKTASLLDFLSRTALEDYEDIELEYKDIEIQKESMTIVLLVKKAV